MSLVIIVIEIYFHKKGAIYRPGIYRGVDLTFGDEDSKNFGGILIRGIVNHEDLTDYPLAERLDYLDKLNEVLSAS